MATLHRSLRPLHWNNGASHTVELFLDFVCPFSKKQFLTVHDLLLAGESRADFVLRLQVQPWHPSSTLLHETAVAVANLEDDSRKFWSVARKLFEASEDYYDSSTTDQTRNDIYRRLAKLIDVDGVLDQLLITGDVGNGGNKVTDVLKLSIKYGRQLGIHVSPSVVVDGALANNVSSSWTAGQWDNFLAKL
ncbi:hypothetical protein PYCC9005_003534 [Savitreella phatthalungensis]